MSTTPMPPPPFREEVGSFAWVKWWQQISQRFNTQQVFNSFAKDRGAVNAISVSFLQIGTTFTLVAGVQVAIIPLHTNTGPSTLSVNGGPPNPITRNGVIALSGGELIAGQISVLIFDGTEWQLQGFGPGQAFSDGEIPIGVIDGVNAVYTLANSPVPSSSLMLFKNGQKLIPGTGFVLAGATITYQAGYILQVGDLHDAFYRF